jgi:hypothetical protein
VIGVTVAVGATVSSASSRLLASSMPPQVAYWYCCVIGSPTL